MTVCDSKEPWKLPLDTQNNLLARLFFGGLGDTLVNDWKERAKTWTYLWMACDPKGIVSTAFRIAVPS